MGWSYQFSLGEGVGAKLHTAGLVWVGARKRAEAAEERGKHRWSKPERRPQKKDESSKSNQGFALDKSVSLRLPSLLWFQGQAGWVLAQEGSPATPQAQVRKLPLPKHSAPPSFQSLSAAEKKRIMCNIKIIILTYFAGMTARKCM